MPAACAGDAAASIQQKLYFTKKLTFNGLFVIMLLRTGNGSRMPGNRQGRTEGERL